MEKVQELAQSNPAGRKADHAKKYLQVVGLVRKARSNELATALNKVAGEPDARYVGSLAVHS